MAVRLFSGPGRSRELTVPVEQVQQAALPSQQRAWVQRDQVTSYARLVVEVEARRPPLRTWQAAFPNQQRELLDEDEVHVHCECERIDPFDNLLARGMETPFYFDRQTALVQALVAQRAACGGMTGLLSARIELYRHQVEAARRLLQDPRQRYLLADELGLGKTIETGVVIRQLRLDRPGARAAILAPTPRVPHWLEELRCHFDLEAGTRADDEVCILPHEQAHQVPHSPAHDMIVVDQAHLLIRSTPADRLERLGPLLRAAPRLLLLSEAALHGPEQELLLLLSWLDPDLYGTGPEDLARVRDRMRRRREAGAALLALADAAEQDGPRHLSSSAGQVQDLFGERGPFHDPVVREMCAQLQRLSGDTPPDAGAVDQALLDLRLHVGECYRLHPRLIRSRRSSLGATLTQRESPRIEHELDPDRKRRIWQAFDRWREQLAIRASATPGELPALVVLFRALAEAAISWSGWAAELVRARLGQKPRRKVDPAALAPVLALPSAPPETAMLEDLLRELEGEAEADDRISLLTGLFGLEVRRRTLPRKTVIFTSASLVCREAARRLEQAVNLPAACLHAGQDATAAEDQAVRFRDDPHVHFLVCDPSGEEGRSFPHASRLIHFDLPLDPLAIERRIARLDSMQRTSRTLPSLVLLGDAHEGCFDEHWLRLLGEGFGVFGTPLGDVQALVGQVLPGLLEAGLLQGRQAWSEAAPRVAGRLAAERALHRQEDILDVLELRGEQATRLFDQLDAYEGDVEPFRNAVIDYLRDVNRIDVTAYRSLPPRQQDRYHDWNNVLMRRDWFDQLRPHFEQPAVWYRAEAQRFPGQPFLRLGQELVDLLEEMIHLDDRGKSFFLWRVQPGRAAPAVFCRLHCLVEPSRPLLEGLLAENRLPPDSLPEVLRLASAFFSPRVQVLFLHEELEPVRDPELLELLGRPYNERQGDVNLGNPRRAHLLDDLIGAPRWEQMCLALREQAVALVEQDPDHQRLCSRALAGLESAFSRRVADLHLALQHDTPALGARLAGEEERLGRALAQLLARPLIRPDAVGVILLAGERCPS